MMFKFKILKILVFFLFTFLTTNSYSNNLKIDGLSKLNFNDLQTLTNIDLNKKNFTSSDINKLIKDFYRSELIYDLTLKDENEFYYISIEENNLIENIYINGNIRIDDELIIENINEKKNTFIDKSKINSDLNLIKNIYKSKGFKFVNVVAATEKFSEDRVNLIYTINEGEQNKIKIINFIGNSSYSDQYLSSLISTKSLKFYNIFSSGSNLNDHNFVFDKNKIINFYKNKGFFDVKVNYDISKISNNSHNLTFFIDEGNRIKINDVILDLNNSDLLDQILDKKDFFMKNQKKNNNFYDKQLIDSFLSSINNLLIDFNKFNIIYQSSIENKNNTYDLIIYEKKVEPEIINSISIYGNDITKDKTIRSKLNFQPGDYFNQNAIDIAKKNLLKYKYINNISISKNSNKDNSDIIINIDENKKTGQIMAAGTFSGDVGAGLSLAIKDNNLLGTGNNLDTEFMINEENTLFMVSLVHYPIASSKINNRYSIFNTEKDLTNSFGFKSKEQGLSYSLNLELNEKTSVSSGFSYKSSNRNSPSQDISAINDNIGTFDVYTLDLSIRYNTTDDFFYPTNGTLNKIYFEYSPKNISDDSFYKVLIRNDLYRKSKNSNRFLFLLNDIGLSDSLDNELKTLNAFSLGGLDFKGFDYRGIGPKTDNIYLGGNKFFTSTIGVGGSFLFDDKDNINTKFFYSVGSIWDSDYISQNDLELRSAVGISFDILTAIGPISFSYAIPVDKNTDDTTREFNFTIGTSF